MQLVGVFEKEMCMVFLEEFRLDPAIIEKTFRERVGQNR
jgi:hypothetical protein